jgi:hypothetical protein
MGSWSRFTFSGLVVATLAVVAGSCGGGSAATPPMSSCKDSKDIADGVLRCEREGAVCGTVIVNGCNYECGTCQGGETCEPDPTAKPPLEDFGTCVAPPSDGGTPDGESSDGPQDVPQVTEDASDASGGGDAKDSGGTPGLCAATPAGDLTIPSVIDGTLTGSGNIGSSKCWGLTVGPDTFFKLEIKDKATGVDIKAQLTPADTVPDQTLVVSSRNACDAPTNPGAEIQCDVHRNKGAGPALHQIFQPGTYLIAVDSFQASQDAGVGSSWTLPFHMTVDKFDFPANAFCAGAVEVMDGTMLKTQDASAGVDSLSSRTGCDRLAVGKVVYFKATVPAGQTLTAKSSGRSAVRILPSCDATAACLASAKDSGTGDGATATWMNAGAAPATVYITLGSNDASASVSYDLSFTIK